MPLSMYQASIPVFLHMLDNLAAILDKAQQHAHDHKIDPQVLLNAHLAPDMYPLLRQVQIVSDGVKGCAARLAGIAVLSFADSENSFAELQARIGKTAEFLRSVAPEQFDGSEERAISLSFPGLELKFSGQDYLLNFVVPNFYFHLSMTYAILRHNGVPLGKMDFLGRA